MPTILPNSIADDAKDQILNALVTAGCTLHSGTSVLDFTRGLFGGALVEDAIKERKEEEKVHMGMNGGFGEGPACKALARAYVLLAEAREEQNAVELEVLALEKFVKVDWEENVQQVRDGW